MNLSSVSVVIPLFNSEAYIFETLNSVVCQGIDDLEIIVIDDCSNDLGPEIVRDFIDRGLPVRLINNQRNMGYCYSRNLGASQASSDWVLFLDSDDQLYPDALSELLTFASGKDLDFVFCLSKSVYRTP